MNVKLYIIILFFLSFAIKFTYAQQVQTELRVDFRLSSAVIEPDYLNNAQQLSEIIDFINRVNSDPSVEIVSVAFCGTASPEGSVQLNRQLAQKRLKALENIIRSKIDIPEMLVSRNDFHISWDELKSWVSNSDLAQKQTILEIINEEPEMTTESNGLTFDTRLQKLRTLDNGSVWKVLTNRFFVNMRSASVVITTFHKKDLDAVDMPNEVTIDLEQTIIVQAEPEIEPEPEPETELEIEPEAEPEPESAYKMSYIPHIHLKTNALGWGLAMANLAGEVDLCKHLSFTLPIYYSSWNYFTYTLKFRILEFQPELRAWLSNRNDGVFFGAHFGIAWYDFAFKGKYRYQDHNRKSPAIGGGVSVGYRMPISKNKRWSVEFAVGGGVYRLHYDTFLNKPNGKRVGIYRKTYVGLDQAAISFAYTFDLKKGDKR